MSMGVLTVDGGQEAEQSMQEAGDSRPVVLVVEDFEDNRFMMRRLLEMSGYRVVEAVNGNQAVECAASEQPDIILMDLSLPQLKSIRMMSEIGRAHV